MTKHLSPEATRERNARIAVYYLAPHSITETAAAFCLSDYGIRSILIKEGVGLRPAGRHLRKKRLSKVWPPERVDKLIDLWGTLPAAEIGARLGTTKTAIIGKAYRLDLPSRTPHAARWAGV